MEKLMGATSEVGEENIGATTTTTTAATEKSPEQKAIEQELIQSVQPVQPQLSHGND